ncbi:FKBP-type peptidyl-prolyl cis-trans isomerase [Bacteroidales bacterium OttesenSCG-928-I21]|nr:FKBP-type peptidyl-prolyl cis-trans isomerase [Bacteroidales bacterium OttesenSCG-928-I21]
MIRQKFNIISMFVLLLIFAGVSAVSCKNETSNTETTLSLSQYKKQHKQEMMDWNKAIVEIDHDVIAKFIERRKWSMENTETGLYWQVYEKKTAPKVKSGDIVEFSYKTYLLNGTVLYTSEEDGNRQLKIDRNQEERGLNEGLKMMRLGEKARFILPPHLAFGVTGDGYKIPVYSILVYEIEVVSIVESESEEL